MEQLLSGYEAWPTFPGSWLRTGTESVLRKEGNTRWHVDGKAADFRGPTGEEGETQIRPEL